MSAQAAVLVAPQTRSLHFLLAAANFMVGLGAFAVVGLLSAMGTEFGLSKAEAGWVMTTYALIYAVASPLLVALTGKQDRAKVLLMGMGMLTLGSVLTAVAPTYPVLLLARVFMAIGGGLVTPVASAIAVASVLPELRGRALATVFGGLTIAQAFGIPLGTWFGFTFGWRFTFAGIALLTGLSALMLWQWVPRGLVVQPVSLTTLKAALAQPRWLLAVSFMVLFMGSAFAVVTYFTPFLEARYGLGREGITALLLVFGFGAIIGNQIGGRLTDRIGPVKTLAVLSLVQIIVMPILTLLHQPLASFTFVLALWSIAAWSVHVPQQARLAALAPDKAPVLLALHSSSIYIGNSVGALIGGQTLALANYDWLGVSGAFLVVLALPTLWLVSRMADKAPAI
jgi:DHA1 family inner membrane transport protein